MMSFLTSSTAIIPALNSWRLTRLRCADAVLPQHALGDSWNPDASVVGGQSSMWIAHQGIPLEQSGIAGALAARSENSVASTFRFYFLLKLFSFVGSQTK